MTHSQLQDSHAQINAQITQQIQAVCHDKNIHCLHAIESGSRAWGFASPDSDFDVRLIYCHSPDWYLTLMAGQDNFEFINNELFDVPFDIGGWDIKKALLLMHKSNAVVFEWLGSPIVYHSDSQFIAQMRNVQHQFFNPLAVFHHYKGMAHNASKSLTLDEPVRLKKWFYLLRALLASVWTRQQPTPPPVQMVQMFDLIMENERQAVTEMIAYKDELAEGEHITLPPTLVKLTNRLWQLVESGEPKPKQGDIRVLDDIFRNTINHAISRF